MKRKKHSFCPGQRVWWNDPDHDQGTDYYFIFEVRDDTALIYNEFLEAEVYLHELQII